jgi:hypothetical protein
MRFRFGAFLIVSVATLPDLAAPQRMALPLPAIEPETYTLRLMIPDAAGKKCSALAQPVTMQAGPLY